MNRSSIYLLVLHGGRRLRVKHFEQVLDTPSRNTNSQRRGGGGDVDNDDNGDDKDDDNEDDIENDEDNDYDKMVVTTTAMLGTIKMITVMAMIITMMMMKSWWCI